MRHYKRKHLNKASPPTRVKQLRLLQLMLHSLLQKGVATQLSTIITCLLPYQSSN